MDIEEDVRLAHGVVILRTVPRENSCKSHWSAAGKVQLSVAKEIDLRTMPRAALEEPSNSVSGFSGA